MENKKLKQKKSFLYYGIFLFSIFFSQIVKFPENLKDIQPFLFFIINILLLIKISTDYNLIFEKNLLTISLFLTITSFFIKFFNSDISIGFIIIVCILTIFAGISIIMNFNQIKNK